MLCCTAHETYNVLNEFLHCCGDQYEGERDEGRETTGGGGAGYLLQHLH